MSLRLLLIHLSVVGRFHLLHQHQSEQPAEPGVDFYLLINTAALYQICSLCLVSHPFFFSPSCFVSIFFSSSCDPNAFGRTQLQPISLAKTRQSKRERERSSPALWPSAHSAPSFCFHWLTFTRGAHQWAKITRWSADKKLKDSMHPPHRDMVRLCRISEQ